MVRVSSPWATSSSAVECLAQWRFVHFHGQKTSRQVIGHSIYRGGHRKRTMLIRIFSPILFLSPGAYLRELEKVWVDGIIVEARWKESLQKLVSEWSDFVLYVRLNFPFDPRL